MKPSSVKILISLTFLFLCQICIFGLELKLPDEKDNLLKTQWTTDEGLPQNTVTKIIQTRDGYLWVATLGGLARFDGIKFTIFNSANTPVIKNNRIVDLVEDLNGVLWFTTESRELIRLQNGVFTAIMDLLSDTLLKIDERNGLWLINGDKLIRYNTEDFSQTFVKELSELSSKHRTFFNEKANVNIWLKNEFDNSASVDFNLIPKEILEKALFVQNITENRLWIVVKNGVGIWENGTFKLKFEINLSQTEGNDSIFSATVSIKDGSLWFNYGKFLYRITEKEITTSEIPLNTKLSPRKLLIDREGNIWLGTVSDGLIRFREKQIKVFGLADEKDLWKANWATIQSADGTVWVATTHGLISLKGAETKVYAEKDGLPTNLIGALAVDKNDVLWIGTARGLAYFKDGKFSKEFVKPENLDPDYFINALYFDKNDALWIGYRSRGVQILRDGKFTDLDVKDGLIDRNVHYIFQDSKGIIWIGTTNGLSRYENENFTNFTVANGLSNNYVRDIYEDSDGTLWIGTYGGGIVRYKAGVFRPITTKDGLFEDIASRILDDGEGNFWVMGNQGISTVKRNELNEVADGKTKSVNCIVFGKNDGMRVSEGNGGNQPAGWRTKDGNLWFPMIEGGVMITPKPIDKIAPPIYIEKVILNDQPIEKTDKIIIHPGGERLEINYTGLSFSKPEQIQFRYKLDEFDKDWVSAGTRRTAFYPYLPPGKYNFSVMAMNSDGVWSANPATIEVEVEAHFWQTWLFYFLTFLLVLAIAYLIFRIRLRQIENARLREQNFTKQLINAQENERQRIAAELHDSIGQDLLIIKNRALLGLNPKSPTSFSEEQLTEISETATHALDETRAIARNLRPQHLQRFGLCQTLKSMVEQVQQSSGIEFQTKIDYLLGLFTVSDELSIFRIVQECLNNIVKHSEAKTGKVEITHSGQTVKILVQDDGKGFEANATVPEATDEAGFGLTSIEQRVKILGGQLKIDSRIGFGTTIIISLSIRND